MYHPEREETIANKFSTMTSGSRDKTPRVSGMLGKQIPAAWNPGGGPILQLSSFAVTGGRQPLAHPVTFLRHYLLSCREPGLPGIPPPAHCPAQSPSPRLEKWRQ